MMMRNRRAMYIVATISKNSYAPEKIREIITAGARVLRFNLSHSTPEQAISRIGVAREVIRELGLEGEVAVMADLPGNKIRLGKFEMGDRVFGIDEEIVFRSAPHSSDTREFIPVDFPGIGGLVSEGVNITIADGEVGFTVVRILGEDSFVVRAHRNDKPLDAGELHFGRGINFARAMEELDHFTPATIAHIKNLSAIRPEMVAFSFVQSAQDIERGRVLLEQCGAGSWNPLIVSKVESRRAVENIDAIAESSDIVLVARGDLGVTVPYELLGVYQKEIVAATRRAGCQVIVSTQILDSLLSYHIPSRAEILDLTNIVLDGADGIMLAKETGISATPGYSVEVARRIIAAVEEYSREKPSE